MLAEKYGWEIQKAYFHTSVKILHFRTPARIQNGLT